MSQSNYQKARPVNANAVRPLMMKEGAAAIRAELASSFDCMTQNLANIALRMKTRTRYLCANSQREVLQQKGRELRPVWRKTCAYHVEPVH
ncbi:hypothetical protein D3C86_1980090 [compost metagenome]